MTPSDLAGVIEFLRGAERLKTVLRSGHLSDGTRESTAEHTWRLCLMAVVLADAFPDADPARLLAMCVVHDLGEALGGDVPAPQQVGEPAKADRERADLLRLLAPLPDRLRAKLLGLWDEYEAAATPEAVAAKGLDKLETILQHVQGQNPPDFDYRFNLGYGRRYTDAHPLLAAVRELLDRETEARADGEPRPQGSG
jgi:putative hydrolase of HD superfamily